MCTSPTLTHFGGKANDHFGDANKKGDDVNLRELARDKPCLVRLPGCDGGGETTVLAHYSLSGISGKGLKSPDTIGAWCCSRCHDLVDARVKTKAFTREELRLAHAEGVMRTLAELERLGYSMGKK